MEYAARLRPCLRVADSLSERNRSFKTWEQNHFYSLKVLYRTVVFTRVSIPPIAPIRDENYSFRNV